MSSRGRRDDKRPGGPARSAEGKRPFPSTRAHVVGIFVTTLGLLVALFFLMQTMQSGSEKKVLPTVTLTGAVGAIEQGKVLQLHLDDRSRQATLLLTSGVKVVTAYPVGSGPEISQKAIDANVKVTAAPEKGRSIWPSLILSLLPVALLIGFLLFFMGPKMGMGIGRLGKSKGRPAEVPTTRFTDVAGADEAVAELTEVVDFLHSPERFITAGATVPHGFLLVGPPGTGKTLLARAVAGEAGVPFFSLSGSDFVETFVGVGASRVRQVFSAARRLGRAIIFIDEIDAVGKARTSNPSGSGGEERENTLNQLLVEMDGFTQSGVIVLAATNRSDVLDPALTRPGRFDRRISVPAPDRVGRTQILELYARNRRFAEDVDFVALGRRTPGLTGADLACLVNEAALEAARSGSDVITAAHLSASLATSVMGRERRTAVITDRDRNITAWHEAGHAVAAFMLPHAENPVSVTIVPRGEAGGVTWMGGNDNAFVTRSEAKARLVVAMGGRVGEEMHLDGDFTQGAASDFASATALATSMVTEYGMSELGVAWRARAGHRGEDHVGVAVDALLQSALEEARALLAGSADLLQAVVDELLTEETVEGDTLAALARLFEARPPRRLAV
ncbi:MAG TPA: AAA family ATPase [Acidimicrobiales bacterium]|nr:AAA family ATPase [Acidimicrobiales bacterium]